MASHHSHEKLAIDGGTPVRDLEREPWNAWPLNPKEEWESEVEPALREVFLGGTEGLPGPRSAEFGQAFAEYCGGRYGVFSPSGTDAIASAVAGTLDLDGLGDGGEVIVPDYTYMATASAPLLIGCSVAFADIHPESFTLDPESVEQAIGERTVAILPVHVGGHTADMDALNTIAAKHDLIVLEDCAQAHGAENNGRRAGILSSAGAFSFQSTKNLTSGEGGVVVTDDEDVYDRIVSFRNGGRVPGGGRWQYPRIGWNYRTSEYLAALLLLRLNKIEEQAWHRNENATYLTGELEKIEGITPPRSMPWVTRHAYHLYTTLYEPGFFGERSRDEFVQVLEAEGVPTFQGYKPLSGSKALRDVAAKHPDRVRTTPRPNVEWVSERSVWLVQDMLMGTREDIDDIVEAVAKIKRAFTS